MTLETHPAAEIFPLMLGEQYESFKADIKERGLIEPIWLYEGKIIDGRNRYQACLDAGIEPRYRNYEGNSPVAFVWSLNGKRRHMTTSQLAAIAVKMLPPLEEEARKRQGQRNDLNFCPSVITSDGRAVGQAAKIVGVGNTTVQEAKRVKTKDPQLFKKVEAGEITVNQAVKAIKGEQVTRTYKPHIPHAERVQQISKLAAQGYRSAQIAAKIDLTEERVRWIARKNDITLPDAAMGLSRKFDTYRIVEKTILGIEGYAQGIKMVNGATLQIDKTTAATWVESLTVSLTPLRKLHKQLMEIANGN